jgi:hypothetical protein
MSSLEAFCWLRNRFASSSNQNGYLRVRSQSADTVASVSGARSEVTMNPSGYESNSSIIDEALLKNDELRSLLGVAPEKKAELPGPHMVSICCTIFSVLGAAFLVRSARLARKPAAVQPTVPCAVFPPQFAEQ